MFERGFEYASAEKEGKCKFLKKVSTILHEMQIYVIHDISERVTAQRKDEFMN